MFFSVSIRQALPGLCRFGVANMNSPALSETKSVSEGTAVVEMNSAEGQRSSAALPAQELNLGLGLQGCLLFPFRTLTYLRAHLRIGGQNSGCGIPTLCMSNILANLKSLGEFVRYFLPAQSLHLSFLLGTLCLYSAPFLSWGPSGPSEWKTSWQEEMLRRSLVLAFPTTLVLFAGVMAFAMSFAGSFERRSRYWKWTWLAATVGIGLTGIGLAWRALLRESQALTFGDKLSQLGKNIPALLADLGPGFHLALGGLLFLAGGMLLHRRGALSLPVRFPATPTAETQTSSRKLRVFSVLIIGVAGFAAKVWMTLALLTIPSPVQLQSSDKTLQFLISLPNLIYSALPAFCAIYLADDREREALRKLFSLGRVRYYSIALLLPTGVFLLPHLFLELKARVLWTPGRIHFLDLPLNWQWSGAEIWLLLLVPPVVLEEIAWRGCLQPWSTESLGLKRGIFIVGLVWGVWHLPGDLNVFQGYGGIVYAIIARLALTITQSITFAWLILRTTSLLSAILLHGTWTLLTFAVVPSFAGSPFAYWMYIALWGLAGYFLFKRYPLH